MNKDNILVSVIMPVYNSQQYLHDAINSVRAQTYINLELILVDDGSKDESPQNMWWLCKKNWWESPSVS